MEHRMMKNWVRGGLRAGLALGALALASSAGADTLTQPGNTCTPSNGSSAYASGLSTYSPAASTVYCGIAKQSNDNIVSTAYVFVNNPATTPATTFGCTMYSCSSTGTTCDSVYSSTTTGGNVSLSYSSSSLTTYTSGYLYASCFVPAGGRINGLRVNGP